MATPTLSANELHALAMRIADDPDEAYKLDHDTTVAVRKHISPASGIVQASPCYANLSVTNWTEISMRRQLMTGLVGYLYRTLDEYEPEAEIARDRKARGDEASSDTNATRAKLITAACKRIAKDFLDRNFSFNPDHHVRAAHPEHQRAEVIAGIKASIAAAEPAAAATSKLESSPDHGFAFMRNHILATYQDLTEAAATLEAATAILRGVPEAADQRAILMRKRAKLSQHLDKIGAYAKPIAEAETLSAWTANPPADVFHQFDRYLSNHHEQLRNVVAAAYEEHFDIEYSVILYDAFKTPEAAREHFVKHADEFRADMFTCANNGITLLGPFKENRGRAEFYNKNTEILKRMHDQLESDHKLGADIMKKQVDKKKRKNIAEAGPDAPGLKAYSESMNRAADLGAKKSMTTDEANEYAAALQKAREIKEDYEVPDDAIQVDMFFPQTDADGNATLGRRKFYSQAEKPTFMQDGCRDEPYQPKREDGDALDDAYTTRVITSRNGETRTVKCPKKSVS